MASTYLYQSPSSNGTSNQKFTWSVWVKRAGLSGIPRLFEHYNTSSYYVSLRFRDDDNSRLEFYSESNGDGFKFRTNKMFRDVHAWYHIVVTIDSTESTEADRMKCWVNGESITDFSSTTAMSYNANLDFNNSGDTRYVGRKWENSDYFDGQMAHVHFTDGYAYQASDFGQTDATTGIWKPTSQPSVTYGTNGFFLNFENSGSMGTDSSGNSNNFTVSGSMTQNIDTPSNVFATFNRLIAQTANVAGRHSSWNGTLTNGNTSAGIVASVYNNQFSNLGVTKGKYYAEFQMSTTDNNFSHGIVNDVFFSGLGSYIGQSTSTGVQNVGYYSQNGNVLNNNSTQYTGSSYGTSGTDIISVALDCDNNFVYFAKNGTYQNSGAPTSGATGTGGVAINSDTTWFIGSTSHNQSGSGTKFSHANFGNGFFGTTAVSSAQNPDDGIGIFEYDVPAGYRALCTKSINAQEYS